MLHNGYYQKVRAGSGESPAQASAQPVVPEMPDLSVNEPIPETVESDLFIPGYLLGQIGRFMRVEFLVGNNVTDRNGRLVKVGASYIILESQNGDLVVCDLFAIKFITIIQSPQMVM